MILSDRDIYNHLLTKDIVIDPLDTSKINPASVDLHLGNKFMFYPEDGANIDVKQPVDMEEIEINVFILPPHGFALGFIKEKTGVSKKLVGRLEGKSSLARLGLAVHLTAGFLDPGNCLNMTLELYNATDRYIRLYAGMPIAQMAFELLLTEADRGYSDINTSKYIGDDSVKGSQMYKNFVE